MSIKREIPEVNAGSMADIAFLLLIFFLVTTTIENDKGLNRTLPTDTEASTIRERNLFRVNLNSQNELLVEGEVIPISDLQEKAIAFLDNGGVLEGEEHCDYCLGEHNDKSSDNPKKAIISLSSARESSYGFYITVQNELVSAYTILRNRESLKLYGISYKKLLEDYADVSLSNSDKLKTKSRIELIRALYPLKLSEAEITN